MASKTVSVSFTTELVDNPENLTLGGYTVALFKEFAQVGDAASVPDEKTPVVITIAAPGTYHVEVARVTDTGTPFRPATASSPFTISAEQVAVPLQVNITVTDVAPPAPVPPTPVVPPVEVPATVAVG